MSVFAVFLHAVNGAADVFATLSLLIVAEAPQAVIKDGEMVDGIVRGRRVHDAGLVLGQRRYGSASFGYIRSLLRRQLAMEPPQMFRYLRRDDCELTGKADNYTKLVVDLEATFEIVHGRT
jgi:hypothetical protein